MKKKILFAACAWLLCQGHAFADEFIINNVTIPQGGTADLTVGFNFTSTTTKVGFTFALGLPEGISLVKDTDGDPVYEKDETSIAKLDIKTAGEGNFAGQPSNENATIKGTSGTLLTLHLSANASLAVGSTHVVNVTKATFQQKVDGSTTDINIPDFTFNITISEPADTRVVLSETSTTAPTAATGVDVRVKRTINAGEWSTICLPFAMTETQVKTAFGDDVELADFKGWEATDFDDDDKTTAISVKFDDVTAIAANKPYIIKVSNAVSEFTADGVTIDPEEEPFVSVGRMNRGTFGSFTGSYVPVTIEEENLFLNGNQFWYSTGKTKMKGYRAYFYFQDVIVSYYDNTSARISMTFDNSTGISATLNDKGEMINDNAVYDLQGRRVVNPGKGVFVKDGKKIIIK